MFPTLTQALQVPLTGWYSENSARFLVPTITVVVVAFGRENVTVVLVVVSMVTFRKAANLDTVKDLQLDGVDEKETSRFLSCK